MISRLGLAVAVLGAGAVSVSAQSEPPLDSLLAHFIERGRLSDWQPYVLYKGCPNLEDWQERGIQRLMSTDLSPRRTDDLALVWMFALNDCNDARLERWYFERMDAAIGRGDADRMFNMWMAFRHADSPAIRDYLRGLMLDPGRPMSARDEAGTTLFGRFDPEERLREYLLAFETMRMPAEFAWAQTDVMLRHDADRLLREVSRVVATDPALADQTAFAMIVESAVRYASPEARRDLGEALQAALDRAGGAVDGRRRQRLEHAARHLVRPPG